MPYILNMVIVMNLKRIFGKNVKYYRFKNHMTQERLAELTDLSPRYISNIETGTGNVSLDTIELLAKALDVRYQDLFSEENQEIKIKKVNMKQEREGQLQ